MRSIGVDLAPWVKKGLLRFSAVRPNFFGLEMHLLMMHRLISEFRPRVVIIDPITNYASLGTQLDVKSMLTRLIDFLKGQSITALFASLTEGGGAIEQSEVGISSLMDTWVLLRETENNGERNRGLFVLKARGIGHSNQIREFLITDKGIELVDFCVGPGVFTGSARVAQRASKKKAAVSAANNRRSLR
jgi:circadian clock protein KaiC